MSHENAREIVVDVFAFYSLLQACSYLDFGFVRRQECDQGFAGERLGEPLHQHGVAQALLKQQRVDDLVV